MFLDRMDSFPEPIFKKRIPKISWQKIYDREYGVLYSEAAVSLLAYAKYHFPVLAKELLISPSEAGTAFWVDGVAWIKLVEGLNKKYTTSTKKLEGYEKQFLLDGNNYLKFAKSLSKLNFKKLSSRDLLKLFLQHQEKRNRYTVFIWSAFILNNYVADKATAILDKYIDKARRQNEKQEILDALFKPEKRAAILQLQYEVEKHDGKPTGKVLENLYERYKWLSCLDLQNIPWTKEEFKGYIKEFKKSTSKTGTPFSAYIKELKIASSDLDYLHMAKRFVYIKDARDDFRRESVFYSLVLFAEIAKRMKIDAEDISYVQEDEIVAFLSGITKISKDLIKERRKGYMVYIGANNKLVCLQGPVISNVLKYFKIKQEEKKEAQITGMIASKGFARGQVAIVRGVKDLEKVKEGNVLVAVATHPDYVPAMRRAVAIVTDEGGVTSHAAIVAREFGIPCIVGTKQATKVLKDGDMVKVNAEEGWVERISNE